LILRTISSVVFRLEDLLELENYFSNFDVVVQGNVS